MNRQECLFHKKSGHPLNRKAPQKGFCEVIRFRRSKKLLLLGSGFASTHFEALFAKHTAFLFGPFS
jgi:hypothetical protein